MKSLKYLDYGTHISNYTPKVKICCILSIKEPRIAIEAGDFGYWSGFRNTKWARRLTENQINEMVKNIPTKIDTFLLTSK